MLVKVCLSGEGQHFILKDILDGLKLFQNMCILAGCDYLSNVRGIGIHRAYQLVSRSDTWFDALIEKGASKDYEDRFLEAVAVFEHQTVFYVEALKTVPLEKWEAGSLTELQHLCGMYP